jgi:hypothetical protein
MDVVQARRARRHQAAPGRSALVAPTLDELRGPTTGVVELPSRLLWRPDRTVNLDDLWSREWMYALVLREATRLDDLRDCIDGATLQQLWPDLNLPRGVRQAWEDRHTALRPMQSAA